MSGLVRTHRREIGSPWRALNPGQQALLVLVYLRKGEPFAPRRATAGPALAGDPLPAPRAGVLLREITSYDEAMGWFTAENAAVLAVLADAVRRGWHVHAWQLPWVLTSYLNRQGRWREKSTALRTALTAAEELGDPDAIAATHHLLGRAATTLGERDPALDHLDRALALHEEQADEVGQAIVHFSLAAEYEQRHDLPQAVTHARRALALHVRTGNRTWQGFDLTALGWYATCLGDHSVALAHCREAAMLMDDRDGLAHSFQIMGCAYHQLGDHAESVAHHGKAITLFRELGDRYREAGGLILLGEAHQAAREQPQAQAAWRRALAILEQLGHQDCTSLRARLR